MDSRLKKKTGPGQIRTRDLCLPRLIRVLQAKLAGNAKKFEYKVEMTPYDSCELSFFTGKSLVPDCNTLAYRKGSNTTNKFNFHHSPI